jgi:HPt (histidine-containing phosphotransfer) domain-containing protein
MNGGLLDEEVWKGLEYVEQVAGPGAIAEMVDNYTSDMPDRLAKLREALAKGDTRSFNRLAHDLKSNSATLGVPRLRALGWTLEEASANGSLEALEPHLAEAEALLPEVLKALVEQKARYA